MYQQLDILFHFLRHILYCLFQLACCSLQPITH